jgi:hypothetical protein
MTAGMIMFYAGIAGIIFFSIILIVTLATAGKQRRNLLKKIEQELQ